MNALGVHGAPSLWIRRCATMELVDLVLERSAAKRETWTADVKLI